MHMCNAMHLFYQLCKILITCVPLRIFVFVNQISVRGERERGEIHFPDLVDSYETLDNLAVQLLGVCGSFSNGLNPHHSRITEGGLCLKPTI